MEVAKAEQDEVQQRKGGVVLEVTEEAAHFHRGMSVLTRGGACLGGQSSFKAA